MKFKYNGERPIIDMGLAFRMKDGADINLEKNCIIHPNKTLVTNDEQCIEIMKHNPHYELVFEEVKPKKTKNKKNEVDKDG